MSFTKNEKEKIKTYLLEQISKKNSDYIQKTIDRFSISKTTTYNYLRELKSDGTLIEKNVNGKDIYELKEENIVRHYYKKDNLKEDIIFDRDIMAFIEPLPKNVLDIWRYSFTEMMNNAIEHSEAEEIVCVVMKDKLKVFIAITDNGVGIFKKIQNFFKSNLKEDITIDDAVAQLFAGKFTTASSNHSGEGIFFTSRAVDYFLIISEDHAFSHDSYDEIFFEYHSKYLDKGTEVIMELSNTSPKKLVDVFDMYTDVDKGFFKTQIPVAHMFTNGYPVSRSEARRLSSVIGRFEEAILDFADVENVGQAFVHELFEVFGKQNPNLKIISVNANENVEKMIRRVTGKPIA